MKRRKNFALAFLFGALAVANVMRNPRFETMHTVDMLQMIGGGMWFGVGLTWLFERRKQPAGD